VAKKSLKVKTARRKQNYLKALAGGKKPKDATKVYNRCMLCGRVGGYMRKFQLCRICFRELAIQGKIMGIKKSSW
jgi:small subunit ribosomal protein S14